MHGCALAEADMQRFFQITPQSVHSMMLTLERRSLISRVSGQPRAPRGRCESPPDHQGAWRHRPEDLTSADSIKKLEAKARKALKAPKNG